MTTERPTLARCYTAEEIGEALSIQPRAVCEMVGRGAIIGAVKVGKAWRFPPTAKIKQQHGPRPSFFCIGELVKQ